jgi:hypothetical protein
VRPAQRRAEPRTTGTPASWPRVRRGKCSRLLRRMTHPMLVVSYERNLRRLRVGDTAQQLGLDVENQHNCRIFHHNTDNRVRNSDCR